MKIVNIEEENIHIFWTNWGNPIEFFRKYVRNNNIESHKKTESHPASEKCIFWSPSFSIWMVKWQQRDSRPQPLSS